ncbi:MAG: hypothetical protein WBB85_22210 [Albidovulum sp.]|uniref:hypothetical protein n=1 Tax=Albidovulum sp. TaxID=1872424 RepID=UPI003CC15930
MKPVLLAAFVISTPAIASAGPIDRACQQSNRVANPLLCECIQMVANMTLTGSDQRLAAKFFGDPAKAQEVRTSGSDAHQAFWQRYVAFGDTAEQICTP